MTVAIASNGLTTHCLAQAQSALSMGHTLTSRQIAAEALERAVSARDTCIEAEACLVLAHAYILESRIRWAHKFSIRAHKLFVESCDPRAQAQALSVVSYAASAMGRDREAISAAKECVALQEGQETSPLLHAYALNYLGVASFWARDFETASDMLETSVWFAKREAGDGGASFQPMVNSCLSEVLRIVELEHTGNGPADDSVLGERLAATSALAKKGLTSGLTQASSEIGLLLLDFVNCFLSSRLGWTEDANDSYLACLDRAVRLPRTTWLQAIVWWARLQRAEGRGDTLVAVESAQAMAAAARVGEHAQLHALAISLERALTGPPLL